MKILPLVLILFTCTLSLSQSREIYVNPNFNTLAKDHKKLAILPFKTIIKLRPKQMAQMSPDQFKQLQKDEGLAVQSAMQSYFLKRKEQHDMSINIQDLTTTNALLAKKGIDITGVRSVHT